MAKEITDEEIELIKNSPVVIVADTETTGFSPEKGASLLEIGAVKVDVMQGKVLGVFSEFIKPMLSMGKIPSKITELTGIKESDVANSPEQEIVMDQFSYFVGNDPIVFHNSTFDWRFLSKAFEGIGIHANNPVLDTLPLSKYLFPEMKGHKLDQMTEKFGHVMVGHHRAIVDAKYTASIYLKMREMLMDNDQVMIMSRKPVQHSKLRPMNGMRILRVKYWKGGTRKRIYVTTQYGVFYYDLNRNVWSVSDLRIAEDENLDYKQIQPTILKVLGLTMEEFVEKYDESRKNIAV